MKGKTSDDLAVTLPFAEEAGEALKDQGGDIPLPEADVFPKYRLTLKRLIELGETPGCPGCKSVGTSKQRRHTLECKTRFKDLLASKDKEQVVEQVTSDATADKKASLSDEEKDLFGEGDEDLDISSFSESPAPMEKPSPDHSLAAAEAGRDSLLDTEEKEESPRAPIACDEPEDSDHESPNQAMPSAYGAAAGQPLAAVWAARSSKEPALGCSWGALSCGGLLLFAPASWLARCWCTERSRWPGI